ncbi:ATP-binding protein [Candidatus Daviesbacteria bacterium]|nr:ATP-binding protein [Candidatus Daviesbacteria bacterium]
MSIVGPEVLKQTGEGRIPLKLEKGPRAGQAEVLYSAITSRGEPLAPWLFSRLQDPRVVGVVISGESGAGKTTLTSQLAQELLHRSVGRIWLTAITSGTSVSLSEATLTAEMRQGRDFAGNSITPIGPDEECDRGKWTPPIWNWAAQHIASHLQEAIQRASRPADPHPFAQRLRLNVAREVVGDIAGIGKEGRLAAHLGDVFRQFPENILSLVVPGNSDIQDTALNLRNGSTDLILKFLSARGKPPKITYENVHNIKLTAEEEEEVEFFLARFNLITDLGSLSSLVAIREGARPGRFEKVRLQFETEVMNWSGLPGNEKKAIRASLPRSFPMVNVYYRHLYAMKLAYSQEYQEEALGIPPDSEQGRVVLIPYLNNTNIYQPIGLLARKTG